MAAISPLSAVVVALRATADCDVAYFLGRAVQDWWLAFMRTAVSQKTLDALHDRPGDKPYTCSPLFGGTVDRRRGQRRFATGEPAWLRVTALDSELAGHLVRLATAPPETITLDRASFAVEHVWTRADEHEWSGQSSYEALSAQYMLGRHDPGWRMRLALNSPTAFRTHDKPPYKQRTWPVPMPDWLFLSLMRRWNLFSGRALPDELEVTIRCETVLSAMQLETVQIPFKGGLVLAGSVGTADYLLLRKDRYWGCLLNLLASYSFYAGAGIQTTSGMGQCRSLVR